MKQDEIIINYLRMIYKAHPQIEALVKAASTNAQVSEAARGRQPGERRRGKVHRASEVWNRWRHLLAATRAALLIRCAVTRTIKEAEDRADRADLSSLSRRDKDARSDWPLDISSGFSYEDNRHADRSVAIARGGFTESAETGNSGSGRNRGQPNSRLFFFMFILKIS